MIIVTTSPYNVAFKKEVLPDVHRPSHTRKEIHEVPDVTANQARLAKRGVTRPRI